MTCRLAHSTHAALITPTPHHCTTLRLMPGALAPLPARLRRLVIYEVENYADPGQKLCCYYLHCLCVCEREVRAQCMRHWRG